MKKIDEAKRVLLNHKIKSYFSTRAAEIMLLHEPTEISEQRISIVLEKYRLSQISIEYHNQKMQVLLPGTVDGVATDWRDRETPESREFDRLASKAYDIRAKYCHATPDPEEIPFRCSIEKTGDLILFLLPILGKPKESGRLGAQYDHQCITNETKMYRWVINEDEKLEKVVRVLFHHGFRNFCSTGFGYSGKGIMVRTHADSTLKMILDNPREKWQEVLDKQIKINQDKRDIKAVTEKIDGR